MDPKNQPQFNPQIPISEVLKQEQSGYTPSVRKATAKDLADALNNKANDINNDEKNLDAPSSELRPDSGIILPSSQIKIIKTYRSDAEEAVKAQQTSVAKIAIAESDQRREQKVKPIKEPKVGGSKKRVGLLLVAIILIALGGASIPAVQYVLNQKKVAVPIVTDKTIIPFDHEETLTLPNATRTDLLASLSDFYAKPPTASTIEYLKFLEDIQDVNQKTVTEPIAPNIFAGLIGPNMPSALARSFDSDYMFGIENLAGQKPFIIFKTSSYEQTFANMLHWENKMLGDLGPIFNLSSDLTSQTFTDRVVINKDVRAIASADGTIVFMYGFLDNQTLIITTDAQTFQDINSRYVAGQFVQ